MLRKRAVVLLLTAALAAACQSGGSTAAPTTVPAATTTSTLAPATTTTTEIPLSQVPAVIDVAYAQRVMDALAKIDGDAALEIYTQKKITQRFLDLTSAVEAKEAVDSLRSTFEADLTQQFSGWANPPAPGRFNVKAILSQRTSEPYCLLMSTDFDLSGRFVAPEVETGNTQLFEVRDGTDPLMANGTQFQVIFSGTPDAKIDPAHVCDR